MEGVSNYGNDWYTYRSLYSLKIVPSNTDGSNRAELDIMVTSGSDYMLEFDSYFYGANYEVASPRCKTWTGVVTSPDIFLDTPGTNQWNHFTASFTANSDTVKMRFYPVAAGSDADRILSDILWIDNVTVRKI